MGFEAVKAKILTCGLQNNPCTKCHMVADKASIDVIRLILLRQRLL